MGPRILWVRKMALRNHQNGPLWKPVFPARDIRALAREWGKKKTYLGAGGLGGGFGGASAAPRPARNGARMMVILMAMQGLGRPGD